MTWTLVRNPPGGWPPGAWPPGGAPPPDPDPDDNEPGDDGAVYPLSPTRILAATAYLDEDITEDISEDYFDQAYRAWAPARGVDLVAVLRHARVAHRVVVIRDLVMLALFLTGLGFVLYDLNHWAATRATLICVVVSHVGWWLARRYYRRGEQTLRNLGVALAVAAGLFLALFVPLGTRLSPRGWFGVLLALGLGLIVAAWHVRYSLVRARLLRDSGRNPRDLAPVMRHRAEDRAALANDGLAVAYGVDRLSSPFIGNGQLLDTVIVKIDVGRGRTMPDGHRLVPGSVEVDEVLTQIRQAVLAPDPNLAAPYRHYVDGRLLDNRHHLAALDVETVCQPASPPPELRLGRNPYSRRHLCLEFTDWNGDVVLSVFVRAFKQSRLLVVELALTALRPVDYALMARIAKLPSHPGDLALRWFLGTARGLPRWFFGAPVRCLGHLGHSIGVIWRRLLEAWEIALRRPFDYGARRSIREHVADSAHVHRNSYVDAWSHAEYLSQRILRGLADHLEERDVDLYEFEEWRKRIATTSQYLFRPAAVDPNATGGYAGASPEQPPRQRRPVN